MLDVQRWAEIRRMYLVEDVAIKEIVRRTGLARNTVPVALRSERPPRYRRPRRPSKLDPFKEEIHRLLRADPRIPGQRVRELIAELGFSGGKTIVDDYLREVRPLFQTRRTYQRTIYRPGGLLQFDLFEPRAEIPVGHEQTRRGWVVTCELGWSRTTSGALVFSKEAPDILWGMGRCPDPPRRPSRDRGLGPRGRDRPAGTPDRAVPRLLRPARRGLAHPRGGRPRVEGPARAPRPLRSNFEPARSFANELDYQAQLDAWHERANRRVHRGTRAIPAERLAEELQQLRPLPEPIPSSDRRWVTRIPQQPYLRFDRNDYSLDPRLVGERVELRVSQREVLALVLRTRELVARHRRSFAGGLTFTAPEHAAALRELRGERRGRELEVEARPLERYDQLIPA